MNFCYDRSMFKMVHVGMMVSVMTTPIPTAVYVNQITQEQTVRQIIVIGSSARTMQPVKMKSTRSPVSVEMGSQERHVKLILMNVR